MLNIKRNKRTDGQEERAQNSKRHKQKRRGALVRLYTMVLLFMLTIGVVLIFTVFFKVAVVDVVGLSRYATEDIIASSGIEAGVNMFRLNRSGISANLVREYSYIKEVRLKYTLPDTVTILVTEAEPIGAIRQGSGYLLFSAENRVLETNVAAPSKNLPIVKGFDENMGLVAGAQLDVTEDERVKTLTGQISELNKKITGSKSGEKVLAEKRAELEGLQAQLNEITSQATARKERMTVLAVYLTAQQNEGLAGITAIDVTDPYNLIVNRGSKAEILLGSEAELAAKVKLVNSILTEELDSDFEGRIDASFAGKAYVTQMDLTAQNMTTEEYAKMLYEMSSSEAEKVQSSAAVQPQQSQAAALIPSAEASSQPQQPQPSDGENIVMAMTGEENTATPEGDGDTTENTYETADAGETIGDAPVTEDEFVAADEE